MLRNFVPGLEGFWPEGLFHLPDPRQCGAIQENLSSHFREMPSLWRSFDSRELMRIRDRSSEDSHPNDIYRWHHLHQIACGERNGFRASDHQFVSWIVVEWSNDIRIIYATQPGPGLKGHRAMYIQIKPAQTDMAKSRMDPRNSGSSHCQTPPSSSAPRCSEWYITGRSIQIWFSRFPASPLEKPWIICHEFYRSAKEIVMNSDENGPIAGNKCRIVAL